MTASTLLALDGARPRSKGWNIALWVLQVALGGMFIFAGFSKLTSPIAALAPTMPWTAVIPEFLVRVIGLSELLGGIGLILPSALRIQPRLTVLAATGLAVVMTLAALFHLTRGEMMALPINLSLGAAAAVIAWGRSRKAVIETRQVRLA